MLMLIGFVNPIITIEVSIECKEPISSLVTGFMIKDRFGQTIYGTNTFHHQQQLHQLSAKFHGQGRSALWD